MKVIFLDFDGVLNSYQFFRENRGKGGGPLGEAGALSPVLVGRLNRLVESTGAEIVVSSSWRHGRTVAELASLLRLRGFRGFVRDKTADWSTMTDGNVYVACERGDEIRAWLDEHPDVESFVIFDDNSDMDGVKHRFIQTDMEVGLTDADVERAIEMLGEKP